MTAADTIAARFEAFHADNPHVAERLEGMAAEWFRAGHQAVAIGMLWEALRWIDGTQTTTTDAFRLNDHYRSRYARLLLERHPEWAGRIKTRELRAA